MFLNNGYPSSFFDKILTSFQSSDKFSLNIGFENCFCIPYLGKKSHHFANRLSALIKNKYNLKISSIYKTFKVVNYFQLKSKSPVVLYSNFVYKFSCSCVTNKTYIGMSSRHLITRVREHLNFKSLQDSEIKNHIIIQICYVDKSIPDRSRPGLPTIASSVARQGTCGNYATAGLSENKRWREGRRMKRQRELWKGRRALIRVGTLNIGT